MAGIRHCSICGELGHYKTTCTNGDDSIRYCTSCKKFLPLERFNKSGVGTLHRYCRWCQSKRYKDKKHDFNRLVKMLVTNARNASKRKGIAFEITIEDVKHQYLKQQCCCYYTGRFMHLGKDIAHRYDADGVISIDRRNPKDGYTKENIVLTSWKINRIKSNLTDDEFIFMCGLVSDWFSQAKPVASYR